MSFKSHFLSISTWVKLMADNFFLLGPISIFFVFSWWGPPTVVFWRYVSFEFSNLEVINQPPPLLSFSRTHSKSPALPHVLLHGILIYPGTQISDFGFNLYSSHFLFLSDHQVLLFLSQKSFSNLTFLLHLNYYSVIQYFTILSCRFWQLPKCSSYFQPLPLPTFLNTLQIKHSPAPRPLVVLLHLQCKRLCSLYYVILYLKPSAVGLSYHSLLESLALTILSRLRYPEHPTHFRTLWLSSSCFLSL